MDEESREALYSRFRKEILPLALAELFQEMDDLQKKGFKKFQVYVAGLAAKALMAFAKLSGAESFTRMDAELRDGAYFLVTGHFNSVLPLDFPFVLGCLGIDEPAGLEVIFLERKKVPGYLDWISRGCVPAYSTKSREAFKAGEYVFIHTFLPPGAEDYSDLEPEEDN